MERERERDIRHSVSNVAAHGSRRIYFRIPRIPTPSLSLSSRPHESSTYENFAILSKKGGHVFVEDRYNKMCRVNGSGFRFEENPVEVYPLGWLQLSAVGAACSSAAVALCRANFSPCIYSSPRFFLPPLDNPTTLSLFSSALFPPFLFYQSFVIRLATKRK